MNKSAPQHSRLFKEVNEETVDSDSLLMVLLR